MGKFSVIKDVYGKTFKLIKTNPVLLVPFLIILIFQVIMLILFYYFPCQPVSAVLVPPVRAFYGEMYIHYPYNFMVLPRMFDIANVIISILFGIVMTGAMIGMVSEFEDNKSVSFKENVKKCLSIFFILFLLWIFVYAFTFIINWVPNFIYGKFLGSQWGYLLKGKELLFQRIIKYGSLLISIFFQALFAYFIQAAVISRAKFLQSMEIGLTLSIKEYGTSFILVFIPNIFLAVANYLKDRPVIWITDFYPEMVFIMMFVTIFLFFISQSLMIVSLTVFFNKKAEMNH